MLATADDQMEKRCSVCNAFLYTTAGEHNGDSCNAHGHEHRNHQELMEFLRVRLDPYTDQITESLVLSTIEAVKADTCRFHSAHYVRCMEFLMGELEKLRKQVEIERSYADGFARAMAYGVREVGK